MTRISEKEFAGICDGIYEDRESICKHNPLGTQDEILLWMLLSILISYLNLSENEIPCFPNSSTSETYRQAILYVISERRTSTFEPEKYLEKLCS